MKGQKCCLPRHPRCGGWPRPPQPQAAIAHGGNRGVRVLADTATPEDALAMRRIVFLAFDRMQLLDLVGPADVFDAATRTIGVEPGIKTAQALELARRRNEAAGYRVVVATADGE